MVANALVAAPLSDGRLQVWASKSDGSLWTFWKTGTDPDSGWSPWQRMDANRLGVSLRCAASLPNKALELFAIANAAPNPPFQVGPGIETTAKVSAESTAAWSGWRILWAPRPPSSAGVGAGADDIAAGVLPDGRIQVFFVTNRKLMTLWKQNADVNAPWTSVIEMPGEPGGISRIATARLSDGRIQLFATTTNGIFTSWKASTNPNDAWAPWGPFLTGHEDDTISAASLPDGRPQIWGVSRAGSLWTQWKANTNPNSAWVGFQFLSTPANHPIAFTAGPLSDGRLQLWVADQSGAMFTCWKASTHPDAAWTNWTPFPSP